MTKRRQDRNLRILEMRQAGLSVKEIGRQFRISKGRAHQIIADFRDRLLLEKTRAALSEQIRQANDIDRKWNVPDLVEALELRKITQTGLIHHFRLQNVAEISLRELMDLAIQGIDQKGHLITSLLKVRCVGKYGFWSIIDRLTEADFGPVFDQEWKFRLAILQRCWRMKGW